MKIQAHWLGYLVRRRLCKKGWELSGLCGLKVTVLVYDEGRNLLTEYNTHPEYDVKALAQLVTEKEARENGISAPLQTTKPFKHRVVSADYGAHHEERQEARNDESDRI